MSKNVADALWELLSAAGVRRCYGIVGDALNPTIGVRAATATMRRRAWFMFVTGLSGLECTFHAGSLLAAEEVDIPTH